MELNQTLRQNQTLSPQMIQSVRLLQMGAVELREYIREQLEENPVLESEERRPEHADDRGDLSQKLEWLCTGDAQNRSYYQDDACDPIENRGGAVLWEESLYDHLRAQIDFHGLPSALAAAVECVLQSLNGAGRLDEPLEDLAAHAHVTCTTIQEAVQLVQSLEPAGVAARSLSECLLLQLRRRGETGPALTIAGNYLEELAQSHYNHIAKQTGITQAEVRRICSLIRSLDPHPGAAFAPREEARFLIPDLAVLPSGEGFEVVLNDTFIPSLRVSGYYRSLMATSDDQEVRDYLTERTRQAQWVVRAVEQRRSTLLSCAKAMAARQADFFHRGPGHLRPMTLTDIAEDVGVHESTVSRAVQDKYLQCAYGVFPLKCFFSRALSDTESGLSSEQAKAALRGLIQNEDRRKPLSDQKLCGLLASQGIAISRRTVAKYREELGIPAAGGRKKS